MAFFIKSTFIKIMFPCTYFVVSVLKTKEEPKKNQGTTYELPIIKKYFY